MNSAPVLPSLAHRASNGARRALPWLIVLALISAIMALMPLLTAARAGDIFPGSTILLKAGWYLDTSVTMLVGGAISILIVLIMLDRVFRSEQARTNRKVNAENRRRLAQLRQLKNQTEWDSLTRQSAFLPADPKEDSESIPSPELAQKARTALEAGRTDEARRLAQAAFSSARSIEEKSLALNEIGDACAAQGAFEAAARAYRSCLEIFEDPQILDKENADLMRAIAVLQLKLGEAMMQVRNFDAAGQAYDASLAISEDLTHRHTETRQYKRDFSIALESRGNLFDILGDVPSALAKFSQSLPIAQELALKAPEDWQSQHDLWITYDRLADLELKLSSFQNARKACENSLAVAEGLLNLDPDRLSAKISLAASNQKMGDLFRADDAPEEAREFYLRAMQLYQELPDSDPETRTRTETLTLMLNALGDTTRSDSQKTDGLDETS